MSESNNGRPRRRAARSAGPPVEDVRVVDVTVDAGVPAAEKTSTEDAAVVAAPVTLTKPDVVPDEVDEESAELDEEDVKLARLGQLIGLAAAAVLVLALVVGATFTALAARSGSQDDDLRAQYTQTARQAVINLTTIRADSAKEDIDRILAVASGEFKNEFDGRVNPFMDVVKQAKVVSTGEVVESGIESVDENSAKVLVAAKQMVSNTGSAEPQARQYRFRITVSKGDSGMTVSKVEFVG
ncbi:hypothetical protein [Nocardia alba]|uniref:Mce-associated membrane protein n=1 Tax=Nocardia alba TaxID=225051 RepID=A0A4R1G6S4_9NOCA|nr:hypothetical protein [Nocardia alba]TCK01289.1 Mce-associated membrane protein [Nocardia alba]